MNLPKKRYYSIGEVCRFCEIEPYTLRYWESRIDELTPIRLSSNRRHFTKEMIETIMRLKELIIDKKFTIDGAARALQLNLNNESSLGALFSDIINIIDE
jgi:DNA-binding transcriptional MerR regulator